MTQQQLELRAQRLKERELAEKERSNRASEDIEVGKLIETANRGKGWISNMAGTPVRQLASLWALQSVKKGRDKYAK